MINILKEKTEVQISTSEPYKYITIRNKQIKDKYMYIVAKLTKGKEPDPYYRIKRYESPIKLNYDYEKLKFTDMNKLKSYFIEIFENN